jgi:CRP/FNR family transcriptional regulator, anaerobic regulatory protein
MELIFQFLNSIYPLSRPLYEHLLNIVNTKEIKKKEYLLRTGKVCKNIYFIEKGLIRCFYLNGEKEISSWFMKEGDVITSIKSFYEQIPSYESIQALENSIVHYISYDEIQIIYKTYLEFNFISRVLTEKYYALCDERLYSTKMKQASDRYKYLMDHHPEIIQRVPSMYISSYLGISLETLSRIKNRK